MSKQPGVMFYFDIRPSLARLTLEEKGRLFEAILDYGQYGQPPQLEGMVGVAWDFIQPRLDRDRERYEEISQKRAQAALARWERTSKSHANACKSMQNMPTTTPNTTTTSTSSSTSTSASTPTPPPLTPDQEFNRRRKTALDALEGYGKG